MLDDTGLSRPLPWGAVGGRWPGRSILWRLGSGPACRTVPGGGAGRYAPPLFDDGCLRLSLAALNGAGRALLDGLDSLGRLVGCPWGRFAAAGRFRLPGLDLRRPLLGSSGCGPFLGCWRPLRGRRAVRPRCLLGGLLSRLWFLLDASVTLAGTVGLGMDGQLVRHKLPAVLQLVDGLGGLALPPLLALVKLAEVLVLHQLGRLPGGKGRLGFAFRPLGLACLGLFLDFLHVVLHIKKRSKCVSN